MADTDWIKLALEGVIGLASGLSGMVLGAYREGRRSERHHQRVKDDYTNKISELEKKTNDQLAAQNAMIIAVERESIARIDSLAKDTGEMGSAIRSHIHSVELDFRDRLDQLGNSIRKSIEDMGDRLENKIDRIIFRGERQE